MSKFLKLIKNEEGATAIEYALIAALDRHCGDRRDDQHRNQAEQHVPERVEQPQVTPSHLRLRGGGAGRRRRLFSLAEPATWAMMLLGFRAVGWQLRRRRGLALAKAV